MLADQTDDMEVLARYVISFVGMLFGFVVFLVSGLFPNSMFKFLLALVGGTSMILTLQGVNKISTMLPMYRKRKKLDRANKFIDALFEKGTQIRHLNPHRVLNYNLRLVSPIDKIAKGGVEQ